MFLHLKMMYYAKIISYQHFLCRWILSIVNACKNVDNAHRARVCVCVCDVSYGNDRLFDIEKRESVAQTEKISK